MRGGGGGVSEKGTPSPAPHFSHSLAVSSLSRAFLETSVTHGNNHPDRMLTIPNTGSLARVSPRNCLFSVPFKIVQNKNQNHSKPFNLIQFQNLRKERK